MTPFDRSTTDPSTAPDPTKTDPPLPETCPACDVPVSTVEKRQLPIDGATIPDGACIADSTDLPATVSAAVHPEFRPDVAVVTHRADAEP